jgi:hypothetical protein
MKGRTLWEGSSRTAASALMRKLAASLEGLIPVHLKPNRLATVKMLCACSVQTAAVAWQSTLVREISPTILHGQRCLTTVGAAGFVLANI